MRWRWRWGRNEAPIAGGARCVACRARMGGPHGGPRGARRLCDLVDGEEAEIARIDFQDPRVLRKFAAMGLLPGTHVTLVRRWPVCVFRVGESEFAVDGTLAKGIYVL